MSVWPSWSKISQSVAITLTTLTTLHAIYLGLHSVNSFEVNFLIYVPVVCLACQKEKDLWARRNDLLVNITTMINTLLLAKSLGN